MRLSPFLVIVGIVLLLLTIVIRAQYDTATFDTNSPSIAVGGQIYAEVTFTDSNNKLNPIKHNFYANSAQDLQSQVQQFMTSLNSVNPDVVSLTKGGTVPPPITTTPPVIPPLQQFFIDLSQLCAVTSVGNASVLTGVNMALDLNYIALKNKVASEYQSAYINSPGWPSCR